MTLTEAKTADMRARRRRRMQAAQKELAQMRAVDFVAKRHHRLLALLSGKDAFELRQLDPDDG